MTTAGTLRTPRLFARSAMSRCFMSSTVISHDGQAMLLTSLIVSSQQPQPALNISTFLLLPIVHIPLMRSPDLNRCVLSATTHHSIRTGGPSIPHGCDHEKTHADVHDRI